MPYVDGFIIPLAKTKVDEYQRIARKASKIWLEHGALEYRECVADDLDVERMVSFNDMSGAESNETVIFSWIVYESKAHRDRVNAKVRSDPRLAEMNPDVMPFDLRRMAYGGFKVLVEAFAEP